MVITLWLCCTNVLFAIPAMYERCELNASCVIGEYVFADDGYTPITTDNFCQITITDSADTVVVNNQNMSDKNDGWYYYNFTATTTEGLYRSIICCDTGANKHCIDKTFIVGIPIESLPKKVWSYTGDALDTAGNAISKVWSYTGSALDTAGNAITKVWSYTADAGRTLTAFGSLAADVWNDTYASVRKLTSREITTGENIAREENIGSNVWGYSSRTLTAFGSLAADIWNDTFAPTRRLTDKQLAGGGNLATESYLATMKSDLITEINENQTLIQNLNNISAADVWTYATRGLTETVDLTSTSTKAIWDVAKSQLTAAGSIGKHIADNLDVAVSSRSTLTANDVWNSATRTLTDYATSTIAVALWQNATRELTNYGNDITAQDVWNVLTSALNLEGSIGKLLAQNVDVAVSTRASQTSVNTLQTDLTKLINNLIVIEAAVNDTGASTTQFITNLTKSTDDFYNDGVLVFTSGNNAGQVRRITDYEGATKKITVNPALAEAPANNDTFSILSQTAVAGIDAQTIWTYGTRTLTAVNLDSGSLATLADLQKQWTLYLSDLGEVLAGKTYRAKLTVLNYESVPTDPFATPTATIYDASRNKVVENVAMTKLSTGVYEYTYSVPSSASAGVWETIVSAEVESGKTIQVNDYWEIEASPAEVKVNEISDNTISSITANVTITNEGTAGYEYQYEYCIVDSVENKCGGGDDIAYAMAAKYISAGESWTTNLTLNVSSVGTYYFKTAVYWGTERSVAYLQFTAVEEVVPPPGGGGGAPPVVPEKPAPPKLPVCKGADFNLDGVVNSADFSILLYFWKKKPPFKNPCVDINKDNKVDTIDFSIMLSQWEKRF